MKMHLSSIGYYLLNYFQSFCFSITCSTQIMQKLKLKLFTFLELDTVEGENVPCRYIDKNMKVNIGTF